MRHMGKDCSPRPQSLEGPQKGNLELPPWGAVAFLMVIIFKHFSKKFNKHNTYKIT